MEEDWPLPGSWMEGDSLAPVMMVSQETIEIALDFAKVEGGDVLYDLGCGDGTIVVTAAKKYGCKAIGVEIDELAFESAQKKIAENSISHLVTILKADLLETDLSNCTVCWLYLLPDGLNQVKSKIEMLLQRGGRVITILWGFDGLVSEVNNSAKVAIHLYTKKSIQ